VSPQAIVDGSVKPAHTEFASLGDTFVLFRSSSGDKGLAVAADLSPGSFIAAYTPTARVVAASAHKVVVAQRPYSALAVTVEKGAPGSGKLIDTSTKVYEPVEMAGFTVMCEPGVLHAVAGLEAALRGDLAAAATRMPPGAVRQLRANVRLWVNASLTYGHEAHPTVGRSMTYHPRDGKGVAHCWRRSDGMPWSVNPHRCLSLRQAGWLGKACPRPRRAAWRYSPRPTSWRAEATGARAASSCTSSRTASMTRKHCFHGEVNARRPCRTQSP